MPPLTAQYTPLSAQYSAWGDVGVLPWDEECFGFPVADLRLGSAPPRAEELPAFQAALHAFAERTGSRLVSTHLDASDTALLASLNRAGFELVDMTLDASLPMLQRVRFPEPRVNLRAAEPEDFEPIVRIACSAFHFGRYHSDPRFPAELANRRYAVWMERAFRAETSGNKVFTFGPRGRPLGFFDVVLRDGTADLRLAAVDPEAVGLAGYHLYAATLQRLQQHGAVRAKGRIQSANVAVLNIYSALQFRFSRPEVVLHWHKEILT